MSLCFKSHKCRSFTQTDIQGPCLQPQDTHEGKLSEGMLKAFLSSGIERGYFHVEFVMHQFYVVQDTVNVIDSHSIWNFDFRLRVGRFAQFLSGCSSPQLTQLNNMAKLVAAGTVQSICFYFDLILKSKPDKVVKGEESHELRCEVAVKILILVCLTFSQTARPIPRKPKGPQRGRWNPIWAIWLELLILYYLQKEMLESSFDYICL